MFKLFNSRITIRFLTFEKSEKDTIFVSNVSFLGYVTHLPNFFLK